MFPFSVFYVNNRYIFFHILSLLAFLPPSPTSSFSIHPNCHSLENKRIHTYTIIDSAVQMKSHAKVLIKSMFYEENLRLLFYLFFFTLN